MDIGMALNPSRDKPVYVHHPIYRLRKYLIINDFVGLILSLLSCLTTVSYTAPVWGCAMFMLAASVALSWIDFIIWMSRKRKQELDVAVGIAEHQATQCARCERLQNLASANADRQQVSTISMARGDKSEDKPASIWPVKWIMIVEFFVALAFIWFWMYELGAVEGNGYFDRIPTVLRAYATIPTLFAALLHFKCWWKQLMHRQKQSWKEELNLENGVVARLTPEGDYAVSPASQFVDPAQVAEPDAIGRQVKISQHLRAGTQGLRETVASLDQEAKSAVSKAKAKVRSGSDTRNEGCESLLSKPLLRSPGIGSHCAGAEVGATYHEYGSITGLPTSIHPEPTAQPEECTDSESDGSSRAEGSTVKVNASFTPDGSQDSVVVSNSRGIPVSGEQTTSLLDRHDPLLNHDDDADIMVVKKSKGKKAKRSQM